MWKNSKGQFPTKLYTMLELADVQGYGSSSNAVAWLPHGRAFRVLDEQSFMESIVPVFFKQTKIRSFYRQLHLWGFKRLTMGHDAGAWYHDFFVRGSPGEMRKMVRIKVKGKSQYSDPFVHHKEPDFYSTTATLLKGTKPAIESLHDDCDGTKVSLSSNESVNEIQYDGKQFNSLDQLNLTILSQTEHNECLGAYNIQHGHVPSTVASSNDLNYCHRTYQAVATTIFPCCDDVLSNLPLRSNDDVRYDDFAQYIDNMIHPL